jgi:hypothetical protein
MKKLLLILVLANVGVIAHAEQCPFNQQSRQADACFGSARQAVKDSAHTKKTTFENETINDNCASAEYVFKADPGGYYVATCTVSGTDDCDCQVHN